MFSVRKKSKKSVKTFVRRTPAYGRMDFRTIRKRKIGSRRDVDVETDDQHQPGRKITERTNTVRREQRKRYLLDTENKEEYHVNSRRVMRRNVFVKNIFEGKMSGKRGKIRPRQCYFKGVYQNINVNSHEQMKRIASDREVRGCLDDVLPLEIYDILSLCFITVHEHTAHTCRLVIIILSMLKPITNPKFNYEISM